MYVTIKAPDHNIWFGHLSMMLELFVLKNRTFIMLFLCSRFSGGQQKTGLEFLMADRGAGVVPVACSLMASFISAISLLGVTRQTLVITQTINNHLS